jgi:hypothetical protein
MRLAEAAPVDVPALHPRQKVFVKMFIAMKTRVGLNSRASRSTFTKLENSVGQQRVQIKNISAVTSAKTRAG